MSERLPILRLSVTLLTLAAAAVAGWFLWRTYEDSPWTRDARVRANVVQVTPDVSGVVIDVRVTDNQSV
jgi:multidrug resistance efflux pump